MSLEIKKFKVDVGYHKVIDGVVEEVDIDGDIYRLIQAETKPETPKTEPPKPEIKPKKRKPKGVMGFSNTYKINIIRDDVNKVIMAIRHVHLGYKPTTKAISDETGLNQYRVRAILGWLKDKAIIKRTMDDEGTLVYRIVKEDWRP